MLIINLYDLKLRKNLTSQIYRISPQQFTLNDQNFTLTFSIQNFSFNTYIDESVYVVEEIPLTSSTPKLIRYDELEKYYSHLDLQTNNCIDWNRIKELNLKGTFYSQVYSAILLLIIIYNNYNNKSKECKSIDEIKQQLEQNYFSFQMSSYVIDVKNEDYPFLSKTEDIFTKISSKIFKEITFYMQPITVLLMKIIKFKIPQDLNDIQKQLIQLKVSKQPIQQNQIKLNNNIINNTLKFNYLKLNGWTLISIFYNCLYFIKSHKYIILLCQNFDFIIRI
ncbi:unnamed protein product [Paramecium pentaurelia]|uniref:Uncharacterized protein n=1 Tax=Paramecium pentaurelia TaxID=43138 RepID=A0A8S1V8G9_9CILI|nr:unnamed protein product [Paramecium pentaurelia]